MNEEKFERANWLNTCVCVGLSLRTQLEEELEIIGSFDCGISSPSFFPFSRDSLSFCWLTSDESDGVSLAFQLTSTARANSMFGFLFAESSAGKSIKLTFGLESEFGLVLKEKSEKKVRYFMCVLSKARGRNTRKEQVGDNVKTRRYRVHTYTRLCEQHEWSFQTKQIKILDIINLIIVFESGRKSSLSASQTALLKRSVSLSLSLLISSSSVNAVYEWEPTFFVKNIVYAHSFPKFIFLCRWLLGKKLRAAAFHSARLPVQV